MAQVIDLTDKPVTLALGIQTGTVQPGPVVACTV